ncbi:hypothetical protein M446_1863 [Methylobacterium sp. 4-46]|uniref:hypothetical protein n=1 Tax=unclassified Methylobacterium TaxID=2615210 RepID=UPI000152E264|nr:MULTISPECIES: hypothetical protein [Methylobacterium]ACA16345.1 hypothetical protein M446_1863 [Methylobacterium sp. 4-46]WFT82052.1 hypothetical protein QA634_09430 [Methylobacterium nodulans]
MQIRVDDHWHYEGDPVARDKRVYREGLLIGRVRRWQFTVPGELTRECFTVECWHDAAFQAVGEAEATFEAALEVLVSTMPG